MSFLDPGERARNAFRFGYNLWLRTHYSLAPLPTRTSAKAGHDPAARAFAAARFQAGAKLRRRAADPERRRRRQIGIAERSGKPCRGRARGPRAESGGRTGRSARGSRLSGRPDRARRAELDATAAAIISAGGTAFAAVADVGDRLALHSAIEAISARLRQVDAMVANAGFGCRPTPARLPLDTADVEQDDPVEYHRRVILDRRPSCAGMLARRAGDLRCPAWRHLKDCRVSRPIARSKADRRTLILEGLEDLAPDQGIAVATICPGSCPGPR